MHCTEARAKLTASGPNDQEVADHLALCELCEQHMDDLRLTRVLRSLEIPEPDPAFLDAMISESTMRFETQPRRWHRFAGAAMFAVLCVVAANWLPLSPHQASSELSALPAGEARETRHISIVIYSHEEQDAELSIALAENLEIEGFAGQHSLTWHTQLTEGKNLLRLPVLVSGDGGDMQVKSRFSGREHQVQVRVMHSKPSQDSGSLMPNRPEKSA